MSSSWFSRFSICSQFESLKWTFGNNEKCLSTKRLKGVLPFSLFFYIWIMIFHIFSILFWQSNKYIYLSYFDFVLLILLMIMMIRIMIINKKYNYYIAILILKVLIYLISVVLNTLFFFYIILPLVICSHKLWLYTSWCILELGPWKLFLWTRLCIFDYCFLNCELYWFLHKLYPRPPFSRLLCAVHMSSAWIRLDPHQHS